jgi:hypothetical protein
MEVLMQKRDTPNIFDLIFKKLLRISKKALICLINAQFGSGYPLDISVEYLNTEHISKGLGHRFSDCLIMMGGKDLYHFEAEIRNNPDMIIRLYIYGFEIGLERKEVVDGLITVTFPRVRVFYWEPNAKTPDTMELALVFPDGTRHGFTAETYKPLEHPVSELVKQKQFLLLPFHILKFRKAVEKARTTGERQVLAGEMRELTTALVGATKLGVREGILTGEERSDLLDLMTRLQNETYQGYIEFEGENMQIINGEIKTDRELFTEQIADLKAGLVLAEKRVLSAEKRVITTAQKLKMMGDPAEKIALVTGLTAEEILRL